MTAVTYTVAADATEDEYTSYRVHYPHVVGHRTLSISVSIAMHNNPMRYHINQPSIAKHSNASANSHAKIIKYTILSLPKHTSNAIDHFFARLAWFHVGNPGKRYHNLASEQGKRLTFRVVFSRWCVDTVARVRVLSSRAYSLSRLRCCVLHFMYNYLCHYCGWYKLHSLRPSVRSL